MNLYIGLALLAGACIAIQAAMNAQFGQIINNSLLATSYAFFTSFVLVTLIFVLLTVTASATSVERSFSLSFVDRLIQVPWYSWWSCVFSVIGVGSFYFLIPKMGVGNMMSYALTGQIIIAMVISHFGLFSSPEKIVSITKCIGTGLLILGIVLINKE